MQRTLARLNDTLQIPGRVHDLASCREWARSDDFPERGRIDFLADRFIEMEGASDLVGYRLEHRACS